MSSRCISARGGIAESAHDGLLAIDMGTVGKACVLGVAARLKDHDVDFVDAPVSGGSWGRVRTGRFRSWRAVPRTPSRAPCRFSQRWAKRSFHCGPVGSGQTTKLVNQIVGRDQSGSVPPEGNAFRSALRPGHRQDGRCGRRRRGGFVVVDQSRTAHGGRRLRPRLQGRAPDQGPAPSRLTPRVNWASTCREPEWYCRIYSRPRTPSPATANWERRPLSPLFSLRRTDLKRLRAWRKRKSLRRFARQRSNLPKITAGARHQAIKSW